jgi:drug/metabolite transporter (DMT)-like permease
LSLAVLPALVLIEPGLTGEFWRNMAVCSLLTVAGNALLVQAVRMTDLSVLGPINAYKAIVSLVPGAILLREIPGAWGLSGMALIVAGTYFLADRNRAAQPGSALVRLLRDPGVQCRLAALVLSAVEAVYLKRALLASTAVTTFAVWAVLGFGVSLVAVGAILGRERTRHELKVLQTCAPTYLMLFATTGVMQFCTIVTLEQLQVGYALALFQTSSLISVALGSQVFQERDFAKRLAGSAVMVAGAALIIIAR